MSDATYSDFIKSLQDILKNSKNVVLLQSLKAKNPELDEFLYKEISDGVFWDKKWLSDFEQILNDLKEKLDQIGEKELQVFATIEAFETEQYEEIDEDKYTEEGDQAEDFTNLKDRILKLRKKLIQKYKDDLKNSKEYFGFLEDIFTSLKKITTTLSNKGYDSFDFDKKRALVKLLNENDLTKKSLCAFLIRIWGLEMNTLTDTSEHIGLRENLLNLQDLHYLLGSKRQEGKEKIKLIHFLNFLIWKHEIDVSRKSSLNFKDLSIDSPQYSNLYEVTLFHKIADELEEDIYFERTSKVEAVNKLKKSLKGTSLLQELNAQNPQNIEIIGWEKAICITRFIKDFVDYSPKNDKYIEETVNLIRGGSGSLGHHDFEFRDKNILYTENFQLSFLIEAYKKKEPVDISLEKKIESTYDNQEVDSKHPSYFREYKLGVYYYLKARKHLDEDDKKSLNASNESEKKLNRARKLYMEMGRFTYPCYAGNKFSCESGIFSLSTFIRHTIETDLQHIERTLHKLFILKDEKKYVIQFRESLREEQKQGLKRTVEILAIFSAIVLFTSGTVQVYEEITSLKIAVAFTVFFASAISLFGFLIYAITRLENKKTTPQILIGLLIVIALITSTYLWFGPDVGLDGKPNNLTEESK